MCIPNTKGKKMSFSLLDSISLLADDIAIVASACLVQKLQQLSRHSAILGAV
jgi:hypothetical protein